MSIEEKALAVVDAFCEALSSKDAEIQQAVAAEVAQVVAGLRRLGPWGWNNDECADWIERGEYKETSGE